MRFDDKLYLRTCSETENERFDVVETCSYEFVGKCKKIPNNSATLRASEDGKSYYYSMTVYAKNPTASIKEGDMVRVYDNTAKETFTASVDGVTALPKKYVRLYITKIKDAEEEDEAEETEEVETTETETGGEGEEGGGNGD